MSDPDSLIGQRVAQYEIVRHLGRGGMGVVYLARHLTLEREVALKFLSPHMATDKDYIDRFLREARAAARLNHPNIIAVYDAGNEDGVYFFVMEYVEGRDASQLLKERKVFTESEALQLIRTAALALAHAHKAGIVHRDIKPENLFLTKQGEVKVGDLGLAKQTHEDNSALTASGVVMGTPYYISPEQIRNARDVDNRTDIYSLGATLFHLLTGTVPYRGSSSAEVMSKHLTEPFPWPQTLRPDLTEGICRVVYKMMAKDANERFQSMEEVSDALGLLQTGQVDQVNASIDISASGIVDPSLAMTQMEAKPSAIGMTGGPHQAAPSVVEGQTPQGQTVSNQPLPSLYTIPPTVMVNRIAGAIGLAIVVTALITGLFWFFLFRSSKKEEAGKPKPNLEELAQRAGLIEAPKQNEVDKKIETSVSTQIATETPQAPTPPPPVPETPVAAPTSQNPAPGEAPPETPISTPEMVPPNEPKPAEQPRQEAMVHVPTPAPALPTGPRTLLTSDFDAEASGTLPKQWRSYIQETVARGEKSKQPYWTGTTQYVTPDGTEATWEVFKTLEAYDGTQVLRVTAHPAPGQRLKYRNGINGSVHVATGRKYTLIFQARAGREPSKASLRVGAPGVAVRDMGIDLIDEWKEVKTQFEPVRDGDISISIILTSPGELWLDAIQFLETTSS